MTRSIVIAIAFILRILRAHPDRLEAARIASVTHGVPLRILLSVSMVERRVGEDPTTDGVVVAWPHRGPLREQADRAAHAIARWHRRCGTWLRALNFYHNHFCSVRTCPPSHHHHRPYGELVMALSLGLRGRVP